MKCLICDQVLERMDRVMPVLVVQHNEEVQAYTYPHPVGYAHLVHLKEGAAL